MLLVLTFSFLFLYCCFPTQVCILNVCAGSPKSFFMKIILYCILSGMKRHSVCALNGIVTLVKFNEEGAWRK